MTNHDHLKSGRNLSPKERLATIRSEFGLRIKGLTGATYCVPGETLPRNVFGQRDASRIGKLFNPHSKEEPWKAEYGPPIIWWLRQHWRKPAPDGLFTDRVESEGDFISLMSGQAQSKPRLRRYANADQDAAALIVARMDFAKGHPAYFGGRHPVAIDDARALRRLITDGGALLPGPELGRVADLHSMCTGCGRGDSEHRLFRDVIDSHWERRSEVLAGLQDEGEIVGFAALMARSVQGKSLAGQLDEARIRAEAVDGLWAAGLMGADTPEVLRVRSRVREARMIGKDGDTPDELAFQESARGVFGPQSDDYLSELRCRACRAVAAKSPRAGELIAEAREVMTRAAEADVSRQEEISHAIADLEFIALVHVERTYEDDPFRFDDVLRITIGAARLRKQITHTTAPLRQAKLYFWLWRALGRSDTGLIRMALQLIERRATVNHLCVMEVPPFRRQLEKALLDPLVDLTTARRRS